MKPEVVQAWDFSAWETGAKWPQVQCQSGLSRETVWIGGYKDEGVGKWDTNLKEKKTKIFRVWGMSLKKDFMFVKDISSMVLTGLTIVTHKANTKLLHEETIVIVQRRYFGYLW